MKRVILSLIFISSVLFGATGTVNLTGEYTDYLSNPFKEILEKSSKKLYVDVRNKDVVLNVESNLDNSHSLVNVIYKDKYVLKNESIFHPIKNYFKDEYDVVKAQNNQFRVEVLSGEVYIDFNKEHSAINIVNSVTVTLKVSVNGIVKTIELDDSLGKTGTDYFLLIRSDMDLSTKNIDKMINEIIEHIIVKAMKG